VFNFIILTRFENRGSSLPHLRPKILAPTPSHSAFLWAQAADISMRQPSSGRLAHCSPGKVWISSCLFMHPYEAGASIKRPWEKHQVFR